MADPSSDNANSNNKADKGRGEEGQQAEAHQDSPSSPQDSQVRYSQYAEGIDNPLPQIVAESVPEPVSNLNQLDCDDSASTRPVVQPDDPVDRRSSAVVYAGEEPSRFRKYRTWIIAGLIMAVIVLTGTVVGVVVANRDHDSSGGGGASK